MEYTCAFEADLAAADCEESAMKSDAVLGDGEKQKRAVIRDERPSIFPAQVKWTQATCLSC
jgi:hypothetical protein